jgi:hypothetical protein
LDPAPRTPEWFRRFPFQRASFTRLAVYERCPAWYRYAYLDWHRSWQTPAQRVGHAVQAALQGTFDGRPGEDVRPDSLESRARARARRLFEREFAQAQRDHERDPNGLGPFDLDFDRYYGYVEQGLDWHLDEVRARLDRRHPRTGRRLDLPAAPNLAQAWEDVRPWHAQGEGDLESVPDGSFQGQYDLVYSWTGGRRIADLKASAGKSVFATEIARQLLSYAWMERELGRGPVEGLEVWFLGAAAPQSFPVPDSAALDAFGRDVLALLDRSGVGAEEPPDPAAFGPAPAQVPGFKPQGRDPSAWCAWCPAAYGCPLVSREVPPAPGGRRDVLAGLVLGVGQPQEKADREGRLRQRRRFTLANSSGIASHGWDADQMEPLLHAGLRAGRVVEITGLRPWSPPGSDRHFVYPSPATRLRVLGTASVPVPADPDDGESEALA